jgi:hypothetical protein
MPTFSFSIEKMDKKTGVIRKIKGEGFAGYINAITEMESAERALD